MGFTIGRTLALHQWQVQVKKGSVSSGFRPIPWRTDGVLEFPPHIPRLSQAPFSLKMLLIDETMVFISFLCYEPVAQRQKATNGREVAPVFQSLYSGLGRGTQGKTAETSKKHCTRCWTYPCYRCSQGFHVNTTGPKVVQKKGICFCCLLDNKRHK